MSQNQLLHLSSASIFLSFWVFTLSFFFYVAHAIVPEAQAAWPVVRGDGTLALGAAPASPFPKRRLGLIATGLAYLAWLLLSFGLGARWVAQGFWPVTTAFEAPVAFSWMIVSVYLIAERIMRARIVGWAVLLIVLGLSGYALFNFGSSSTVIEPLRPALQSNWLRIHVGAAMVSYSFFALGGAFGLTYLMRTGTWRSPHLLYYALWPLALTLGVLLGIYIGRWPGSGNAFSAGKGAGIVLEAVVFLGITFAARRSLKTHLDRIGPVPVPTEGPEADLLEQLDEWGYRSIAIGLPLIAFVLMSGAIWAQLAWSTFWSWDPKEVWALITFAFYAVYVHIRVQRGWRGAPMAFLGVIGFLIVLTSFLGLAYIVGTMGIFSLHTFGNVQ
jgi:cytochrome c-type biogenesis protein CcsB